MLVLIVMFCLILELGIIKALGDLDRRIKKLEDKINRGF